MEKAGNGIETGNWKLETELETEMKTQPLSCICKAQYCTQALNKIGPPSKLGLGMRL